jgi:hypothetical protein
MLRLAQVRHEQDRVHGHRETSEPEQQPKLQQSGQICQAPQPELLTHVSVSREILNWQQQVQRQHG